MLGLFQNNLWIKIISIIFYFKAIGSLSALITIKMFINYLISP